MVIKKSAGILTGGGFHVKSIISGGGFSLRWRMTGPPAFITTGGSILSAAEKIFSGSGPEVQPTRAVSKIAAHFKKKILCRFFIIIIAGFKGSFKDSDFEKDKGLLVSEL
jgi:hypothetical protein